MVSLFFIPKANRLQAQFVFLFVQFPTWLLGLVAVETGLLSYPVHELGRANSTSFIFEYLILPIYCVHFNARYPRQASLLKKILYYSAAALALTGVEILVERYTDILEYTGWHWYMTSLSVGFVLWLSHITALWFFKKPKTGEQNDPP